MISRYSILALSAAAIAIVPAAAFAQATVPHRDTPHDDEIGTIVVSAGGIERLDMLAGATVVEIEELTRNLDGQIGEVLAKLPGVTASGFAPGASRPVLRGFSGERVRVLTDGIGAIDASNTSADHAVTINPLTADSIEVLRGPAVLLYGSSAIGGAVNVIDRRIPHSRPEGGKRLDMLAALDTASNLRELGGALDLSLAPNLVWHSDASWRQTDDVEIPGFTLTPALRADLLADAEEEAEEGHLDEAAELIEAANQRGTIPNTATETLSLGTGLTWFGNQSSLGFSVGYYDTLYGVPTLSGAHAHGEGEEEAGEEGPVRIDLEQWRADLRGEFHIGEGFFHDLVTRWGYSDYTHVELEGDEIGTTFNVKGVEGRLELIQSARENWSGSVGGQFLFRDFEAIGAEAFVPPNTTTQFALFTLQEMRSGPFEIELGARYENTSAEAETLGLTREFGTVSGALGLSWSFPQGVRAGLNLSRAERAPSAEELFADGPHIATGQYELGDPDLASEKAWGAEAYVRAAFGGADFRLAAYRNWFDDFIYLADTGLEEDGLPVFAQNQQGATWSGIEAEATAPLADLGAGKIIADARAGYVHATLDDGTPVPRIPPLSLLGALEYRGDALELRGEVEWNDAQTRIAPFETATDAYTHVNLSATFRPFSDQRLSLIAQVDNLLDAEGRRHASFTKDFVPLAGRNFKLALRSQL